MLNNRRMSALHRTDRTEVIMLKITALAENISENELLSADFGLSLYIEFGGKKILLDTASTGKCLENAEKLGINLHSLDAIVLSHGHFDHIWGVEELRERSGAEVYAYEGEEKLCQDPALNVSAAVGRSCGITPDHLFRDGEEFEFAGIRGRVIATPGHTGGSCCYYFEEDQILISGDTLFQESVGRTDFPTGSMSALVRSVKEKLFTLPDETRVYPGHGMMTTIGYEKENNAFV